MTESLGYFAANFLNPALLFFVLGMFAGLFKSDLSIPESIAKGLSIYLMVAIGLKGGVAMRETDLDTTAILALVCGLLLSFGIPFIAFGLLKLFVRLKPADAAALSAHYGSVSVVTFVTAVGFLNDQGIPYEGFMVAVMALMETPAIISGLIIAHRVGVSSKALAKGSFMEREVLREVFLSSSVILLLGSFLIGAASGPERFAPMKPFVVEPFYGILCLFLLDMGLVAARRLRQANILNPALLAFGVYMALIGASLGLGAGILCGLSAGGTFLLMVLCASASYIAVPAAMRLAIPKANPAVYITMALAVTFPFNIMFGIPLYLLVSKAVFDIPWIAQ